MKQILSPCFFQYETDFLQLRKMFNAIVISRKNMIKENVSKSNRTTRDKLLLEDLKEEYLHAIITRKSCEVLSNICQVSYLILSEEEQRFLPPIDWKQVSKELRLINR